MKKPSIKKGPLFRKFILLELNLYYNHKMSRLESVDLSDDDDLESTSKKRPYEELHFTKSTDGNRLKCKCCSKHYSCGSSKPTHQRHVVKHVATQRSFQQFVQEKKPFLKRNRIKPFNFSSSNISILLGLWRNKDFRISTTIWTLHINLHHEKLYEEAFLKISQLCKERLYLL